MYFAHDANNQLTDIKDANNNEQYRCIGCNEMLRIKAKSSTRVHKYFSHLPGTTCEYEKNHDMSEWHYEWQRRFPGCCEVPMPKINPVHRADVLVNNKIIEFQHSPISEEEFQSRNSFYPNQIIRLSDNGFIFDAKCSLAWVFDMNEHVKSIENGFIKLKKRNDLFKNYDMSKSGYALFFEINEELYLISSMNDETGWYYLGMPQPMDKDVFVVMMKQPIKVHIKNATEISSIKNTGIPKNLLPGYNKFVKQHGKG